MSHKTKHQEVSSLLKNQETWIAVDWGTSRLRVWHMSVRGEILGHKNCEHGMNSLLPDAFEAVLLSQINTWLNPQLITTVLACGMLGSRQGWMEVSYVAAPCLATNAPTQALTQDPRIQVYIFPGIKQLAPADVMRGEETQIAGFMAQEPEFNGVICLPGTHAKWVQVQGAKIIQFQTYLTGELYALLAKQSVLRHCLDTAAWDDEAFAAAIKQSIESPQSVSAKLFSLRAQTLLNDLAPSSANAALSGYLIGLELASCQHFWQQLQSEQQSSNPQIIIIGDSTLSKRYAQALSLLGISSYQQNSESLTLQGLALAHQQFQIL
ncbi:MAG: 2-dehydro-3-deoxygalactonokinase [Oceanospirillaceae bacterium]|jgi:2-dehydro-3-deoxygalactonokinase